MDKAQSRQQTDLTIRKYSSSPCWVHEVDPGYLGYWSKEEVVGFLKSLLERERAGAKAFADIGQAADLRIADLILESEIDQGSICVLLQREIAMRGAVITAPRKRLPGERRAGCSLEQAIASARSNQVELVQTIGEAVLNIFDSELNAHLMGILQLHRKQIGKLKTIPPRGLGCSTSFRLSVDLAGR